MAMMLQILHELFVDASKISFLILLKNLLFSALEGWEESIFHIGLQDKQIGLAPL